MIQNQIKKLIKKIRIERVKRLHKLNKEKKILESKVEYQYLDQLDISEQIKYKRIQKKSLSCEISATADIVSYLEKKRIAESFFEKMLDKSYYNRLPEIINWKKIWWNPNAWYVWYIGNLPNWEKAEQYNYTWYWVLEEPIDKIYKKLRYETKIITNKNYTKTYNNKDHLTEILKALNEWKMVQLWWDYCTTAKYEDTKNKNYCKYLNSQRKLEWYYKQWNKLLKHEWLIWEHAFYLLWYKWWVNNPSHIIVWDTKTWKHTYPTIEWMRKWDRMQNRSIIIKK